MVGAAGCTDVRSGPSTGCGRAAGGENRAAAFPVRVGDGAGPKQIDHSPCDGRRRVEEIHRPGRELPQAIEQQRIVGAGEHDRVGALAVVAEARRISVRIA